MLDGVARHTSQVHVGDSPVVEARLDGGDSPRRAPPGRARSCVGGQGARGFKSSGSAGVRRLLREPSDGCPVDADGLQVLLEREQVLNASCFPPLVVLQQGAVPLAGEHHQAPASGHQTGRTRSIWTEVGCQLAVKPQKNAANPIIEMAAGASVTLFLMVGGIGFEPTTPRV